MSEKTAQSFGTLPGGSGVALLVVCTWNEMTRTQTRTVNVTASNVRDTHIHTHTGKFTEIRQTCSLVATDSHLQTHRHICVSVCVCVCSMFELADALMWHEPNMCMCGCLSYSLRAGAMLASSNNNAQRQHSGGHRNSRCICHPYAVGAPFFRRAARVARDTVECECAYFVII